MQTKDILGILEAMMPWPTFEEVCMKLWKIWRDRCTFTHGPNRQGPLFQKGCKDHWTVAFLEAYRKAQNRLPPRTKSPTTRYPQPQTKTDVGISLSLLTHPSIAMHRLTPRCLLFMT